MRGGRVVEDHELAVCAEGRGRYEGFAGEDAGVGDEVAGGGGIGAVEDVCVLGEEGKSGRGSEMFGVSLEGDV